MGVENVLHMNPGNGEASYANNSSLQKIVILKARQVLEDTMNDYGVDALFPEHFRIADLGCSSGPNTLLVLSNIIDNVHAICQKKNLKAPEFQVFLNDLPDNDFNTIFKMLPPFYAKVKKEKGDKFGACFVSGVSGSFYTRLFPCRSLHFVHSSYSLHWLSQVPENLENNKGNIYMSKKSPPNVYEAYWRQYLRDFSTFLRIRSEEITDNGRMVLTFIGRSGADPTSKDCCCIWDLLATSLHDMVAEGLIGEADINSFNIPIYNPCMDEVKAIIQMEGLFILNRVETFEVNWGVQDNDDEKQYIFDKNTSGKAFAKTIRAVAEPMLASHFGNTIIDNVFQRYAMQVDDHLSMENINFFNIVISLTRRSD